MAYALDAASGVAKMCITGDNLSHGHKAAQMRNGAIDRDGIDFRCRNTSEDVVCETRKANRSNSRSYLEHQSTYPRSKT